MGWWRIKDVESGGIDFDASSQLGKQLANAIPGEDDPNTLFNGDGPADVMQEALAEISALYEQAWGRPAKKEELTACFNFCCNGF